MILGTIGSSAPFIGLFGTVIGILRSFQEMAKTGSGGFAVVASGISESLIATAAGIVVAVVAVMSYNAFQIRWGRLTLLIRLQMEELAEMLDSEPSATPGFNLNSNGADRRKRRGPRVMAFKTLGASDSHEGEGDIVAEINITPLTDIFLVLLIVFMVTSSVMNQMGVDVHLPTASSATAQSQPEGVIVTLLPAGAIRVNEQSINAGDYEGFETALKERFGKTASKLVITIEGDRQAYLGSAIEIMDHARTAGAEQFAIATAPEGQ